jgi:DNA polymerase-3 subunit beta
MKFRIPREELLPALQTVNGVVERRQTLPILSNLLMKIDKSGIKLTATDMEVELIALIEGEFDGKGEITLPARKLLDICRTLPDESEMNLNITGDKVLITTGKSRFTLATLPAQEFPAVEATEYQAEFTVNQGKFKDLLDKTGFAMAQQDVRYYLNGLLLEISGNNLRAVATDGHRLAMCETEVELTGDAEHQIIVPRKAVTELIRLLKEGKQSIKVQISNNHIHIELDNLHFTSKLIDGKFPDYGRVIPANGDHPIVTDKETLRQSLTRASILSNEKYRGVRIILENNRLRALAHNPEQEEAEEEIDIQYEGDDLEIGFNVSYLLDALNIIRTDEVEITISDPNSSCLILPVGTDDCKYVVMPMRL